MKSVVRREHHTDNFFERLGLAMLLATNSSLSQAWAKPGSVTGGRLSDELEREVTVLGLSDIVARELRGYLGDHVEEAQRGEFLTAAGRFGLMYSGDPCPRDRDSVSLFEAFKELDRNIT